MTTAQLAPLPIQKFFDNNGLPLSGGKLYSYAAGTNTPQATYPSQSEATPNTNPVVLNARGEAAVWLDPTLAYKLNLKDPNGNQIPGWPVDNILLPPVTQAQIGQLLYPQTAAEIAAGVTPVNYAYPAGNVLRYGANTTPGTTDMTTAIQNAVSANPNGQVIFPPGTYKISAAINITKQVNISAPWGLVTIVLATQNQYGFVVGDGTSTTRTNCKYTQISGLTFNPSASVAAFSSGYCIYLNTCEYISIRDCVIYGNNGSANILSGGVNCWQTVEFEVFKCRFSYLTSVGVACSGSSSQVTNDGRIDYCEFTSIAADNVYIGTYANGITVNFPICYQDQSNYIIHIDTTGAGEPYNIFINQPDFEIDNAAAIGIYCSDGAGLKQVNGGWMGAATGGIGATAINVISSSGGFESYGVDYTEVGILLSGPFCTIEGGQVGGNNTSSTLIGIQINGGATDTLVSGVRVWQWQTYGIDFVGSPARCSVVGCLFKNNGADFNGYNYTGSGLQPQISGCRTDSNNAVTPAASITLHPALPFYTLAGASTQITTMTPFSQGQRVTLQAQDSAGDNFATGGNIVLPTSPLNVPQFRTVSFICDGVTWYQDSPVS